MLFVSFLFLLFSVPSFSFPFVLFRFDSFPLPVLVFSVPCLPFFPFSFPFLILEGWLEDGERVVKDGGGAVKGKIVK